MNQAITEKSMKRLGIFLFILSVALVSLIYPGYRSLSGDQEIYLPQINHRITPESYGDDFLFQFNQADLTLFSKMVILIHRFDSDIFPALFFINLLVKLAFFYSLYRLAFYFTGSRLFSLSALLIYVIPLTVFGTSTGTSDFELLPRDIAFALALLSTVFYLNKKDYYAAPLLGLSLLFHSLTAIPFLIIFYINLIARGLKNNGRVANLIKLFVLGLIPIFAGLILFRLGGHALSTGLFARMDAPWAKIAGLTDPYIFIRLWDRPGFSHFFSALIFFIVVLKEFVPRLSGEKKETFWLWILVPLCLFGLSIVTADLFKLGFFTALQLGRTLILWKIILPIAFSFYAFEKIKNNPENVKFNFFLGAILASLVLFELVGLVFLPGFFLLWLKEGYSSRSLFPFVNAILKRVNGFVVVLLTLITAVPYIEASTKITGDLNWAIQKFLILAGLSLVAVVVWRLLARHPIKAGIRPSTAFVASLVVFILTLVFIHFRPIQIEPAVSSDQSFLSVCVWFRTETKNSDVVLSEPFSNLTTPLRYFCHKTVFGARDGTQSIFSRSYALEWARRLPFFQNLGDDANLKARLLAENIGYVLSASDLRSLAGNLVFSADPYRIYRIAK